MVPACGMHVNPPQASLKELTGIEVGPVKVEFDGVAKSTWNLKRPSALVLESSIKKFGSPEGGGELPSRSEGRRLATLELFWKQMAVPALPASILVRSKAQACAPTKAPPLGKVLVDQ